MLAEESIESIYDSLFADEDLNVFAVLDGASIQGLLDKLYGLSPDFYCLFRGELEPDMAEVAPYLVKLDEDSDFTRWVIKEGWGNHWGIFAVTDRDTRAMRRHFRAFLNVYDESGNPLHFRYYDPRVLRTFLPTCNSDELKTIFGSVSSYLVEGEEINLIKRFEVISGSLGEEDTVIKHSGN
jgi:hypothetical protein